MTQLKYRHKSNKIIDAPPQIVAFVSYHYVRLILWRQLTFIPHDYTFPDGSDQEFFFIIIIIGCI